MPLPTPAADDPLSWRVLLALAARLERVRVANGYLTDIGADVRVDGPQVDLSRTAQPITWVAASEFDRGENSTQRLTFTAMTLGVTCFVPGDSVDHMRLAHRACTDLRRVFLDTSRDMPASDTGGTVQLTVVSELIETRPEGAPAIAVQITAQAGLVEKLSAL